MAALLSADTLARYAIQKCIGEGEPISNLQLQKILYFCQRKSLQTMDDVLFDDEIQAWQYGPVVPSVYRTFSLWGGKKISWLSVPFDVSVISDSVKSLIDSVIEEKREKEPWQLVGETHVPGSAWYTVYDSGIGDGKTIPVSLIKRDSTI